MKKLLKSLANLKLAIFLLLTIAFFSALGSVLEQDKPADFYVQMYSTAFFNLPAWQYLLFFGLDHIYTTWWFFLLLLLFGLCLMSCTFLQQFPALKLARRYYFYTSSNQFSKLDEGFQSHLLQSRQLCFGFSQQHYALFQTKSSFYAYKGLMGRLGPILVHLSILCILMGSFLGAFTGFTAQELVPKSEVFHLQNLVRSGSFSKVSQQAFRVNDFWVNYHESGLIKQFQSDISILSGQGQEVQRKTISVNNPLVFDGLTLYQTDWGLSGVRLQQSTEQKIIQLPVAKALPASSKEWIGWLPFELSTPQGVFLVLNNGQGKVDVYNQTKAYLFQKSLGQSFRLEGFPSFQCLELIFLTGLQIKIDPGIPTIYLGFACLIFSSFVSFTTFSEIWYLKEQKTIFVGGRTNRAKLKFKQEMSKWKRIFF